MAMNEIRTKLHMKSFGYDTERYPFRDILRNLFGCELGEIHKHLGDFAMFDRESDQSTLAHRVFYSNFALSIKGLYNDFVRDVVSPIVGEPFYLQQIPTFRLGLPGNRFVGEFHKDSRYNHLPYEVNFNLGLCGYLGEAALKVETSDGSGNYVLMECPYGQIFSFDHIDCLHGSEPNPNDETMVSFDFRIALSRLYYDSSNRSVNMATGFRPGEYFSKSVI